VAADAATSATLANWRERLVRRLANRPEGFTKDGKLVPGRMYRPLNKGTLSSVQKDPEE
jgi:hypothetical protein